MYFLQFLNYHLLDKGVALYLNKLESASPRDALLQVWLKLAQWCRRNFLFFILSMYFCYLVIISPWKRAWPFIWTNLNPLHPRMHCAKFGWNWPSGSREEFFFILSMYFCYLVIISPWKRTGPFIGTNLNPFYRKMLFAKCGWLKIGPVVLEKKMKMWKVYDNNNNCNSSGELKIKVTAWKIFAIIFCAFLFLLSGSN